MFRVKLFYTYTCAALYFRNNWLSSMTNPIDSGEIMKHRIQELEKQIADLKHGWPSHSVPPGMMAQLDELEEELRRATEQGDKDGEVQESNSPV